MKIKIIDINSKETLKELKFDIKKEIEKNKSLIDLGKSLLGFSNAKFFDFLINAVEKSEGITVLTYVKKDKFKDILDKINE